MSSVCGASTFVNYAKNLEQLLFKDTNLAGESQNSIKTIVMGGTTVKHRNDYARENLQNNVKAYEINPQLPEKDQIIALSKLIPCDWINLTLHRSNAI